MRAEEVYALLVRLLEAPTTSWSERPPTGAPTATLEYVTDEGARGRLDVYGDRATWSVLPRTIFRLASEPPAVPPS